MLLPRRHRLTCFDPRTARLAHGGCGADGTGVDAEGRCAGDADVYPLPAVMRCRVYVQKPRGRTRLLVSKRNILLRDRHTCQCAPVPRSHAVHHPVGLLAVNVHNDTVGGGE